MRRLSLLCLYMSHSDEIMLAKIAAKLRSDKAEAPNLWLQDPERNTDQHRGPQPGFSRPSVLFDF